MKKTLILALMVTLTAGCAFATTATTEPTTKQTPAITTEAPKQFKGKKGEFHHKAKADFEKRLNLTEEQKIKAKELRQKGHEEMKPIMEQIKDLKQKKEAVKLSRIAVEEQEKRIAEIDLQLKTLKKQAHELRAKNMKEFEAILNNDQKKELKKMKKEGRKNFEKMKKDFDKNKKKCAKETNCECPMKMPKPPVENK